MATDVGRAPSGQALVQAPSATVSALTGFDPSRSFWTEDYIDGAATARRSIYRRDGSLFTDRASNYDPPENGIHLCGVTDDGEQPTTAALYEMPAEKASAAFLLARDVAACGKDEADFVVDLFIAGSVEEDFWSNRQLWSLAIRAWNAAIAMEAASAGETEGLDGNRDSAGLKGIAQTQSDEGMQ